ncbi:MAG: glycosyltransferase [Patescibacteria group bacterium]|nr:glycosyltransferase [Patescibacteria group bacterium]
MKTFEIPACRGFLICNKGYQLDHFFEINKEIVVFESEEEMLEKIDFYLKNDKLREEIREAGYKRLISSNYSYIDRAKIILEVYRELY